MNLQYTDNGYYAETTSSYTFPVSKFRQPLYVVTAINNGVGDLYSNTGFFYKNARIHKQGKGFLGFEEIRSTNYQQSRKTTTQYGFNSTYYNVYPVKQTVTTTAGDSISRTEFQNNFYLSSGSKVIFPYIQKQTTVDKLTGMSKRIEYTYASANHGNPSTITETQGSLITTITNSWEAKGGSIFKNRVTQQTITKSGAGPSFSETKNFTYDAQARLTQQVDYYGHPKAITTAYSNYDLFGNPQAITVSAANCPTITANGIATHICYDDRGFQRILQDANLTDSLRYEYNAYGQLTEQTNARHQTTIFQYDAAGRMTSETRPENTLTYQYVPSGNGIGQIQTVREGTTTVQSYAYTPWGQIESVTENIDSVDYTTTYSYNSYGQLQQKLTPSGFRIGYQYTNGALTFMRNVDTNSLLWQADAVNALGEITESTLGNGLKRILGYDTYHFPNQIALKDGSAIIDQVNYVFNAANGNLKQRNDITHSRNEFFGYDLLNRLDSVRLNSGAIKRITYFPNGNIQNKFDVGTYLYENNNHAVSGVANPVTSYSPMPVSMENTSYNRVHNLTLHESYLKELNLEYSPGKQRRSGRYYIDSVLQKTMIYAGDYEKEIVSAGNTKEYDYICTPEGLSAIAIKTNGTRSLYYVHTDHLGSIRTVTTASKAIQTRYYYDAWGKQTLASGTAITNRGYLAQEHLNDFGLLNLNARLYDPALGRFLAMDPYVSMPDFTQAYNRYSYCLNNPFKYTDPSGEIIFTILAAIFCPALLPMAIQTDIGWITGGLSSMANGGSFWEGALIGGAIGAINGALSMVSPINIPFGNSGFGLSVAPQIALGTDGLGMGLNVTLGYEYKSFNTGVNFGGAYYASAPGTGASGFEGRIGYGIGFKNEHFQAGIGSTYFFSGTTSQQTGQMYAGGGNWKITYENDTWAPVPGLWNAGGPGRDRYRTAAVRLDVTGGKLKGLNAGLNIFTGLSDGNLKNNIWQGSNVNKYRMGVIYAGYYNARIGYNSEKNIRGPVQNGFHDMFNYGHFEVLNLSDRFHFGFYSSNPYTLW